MATRGAGGSVADSTARRLRADLAAVQIEGRLPSVVAGLVGDGGLIWCDGFGDVGGDPADTQYRIGSITKTLTAVLVLQAADEGLVDLDAPVSLVLGDVGYADRSARTLLAHHGGVQAEPAGDWWERTEGGSFADLVTANDGGSAVFPVGHRFHYSNLAYALLGELVARVRGESWWDVVRGRLLEPLGMTRTTYHPQAPHAQGYSVHPYARTLHAEPHTDTGAMAPAGQVWSTVGDLARYAAFLVAGDPLVLTGERFAEALTPRAGDPDSGLGYAHGLGFQLFPGGSGTLAGHSGSMPGFVATCFVDRARRTGAVALSNATSGMSAAGTAQRLLETLEAHEPSLPYPWEPNREVPAGLGELLGVWHWGATMHVFELEGQVLVVRKGGVEVFRFGLEGERVVGLTGYHAGEELTVVRSPDGAVSHLDLATFIFTRSPYDPSAPIPGGVPD